MGINLQKGQRIDLTKGNTGLSEVLMGLGWEGVSGWLGGSKDIDLDASVILFDENKNVVDLVSFRQLRSKDGSIIHSGDNRTGAGAGDDEKITVSLARVPSNVKSLIFVVNSFTGQTFKDVKEAYVRLVDVRDGAELARITLSEKGAQRSAILASVYRNGSEWKMAGIGELAEGGRTAEDLIPAAKNYAA